jgi:ubiquinone/menaquinone biosynthesis C-methylase UbiE
MMNQKGNEFKGLFGGANYKRFASFLGMGIEFYRKGVGAIKLSAGMKALDLGCGPGGVSFVLAETAHPQAEIFGIDISDDQLNYAQKFASRYKCKIQFNKQSMDELPYPDDYFDFVLTSMALHETPPEVRRDSIVEVSRVLKKNGRFVLVDWSKPKFGLLGIVWYPFTRWGQKNKDNWHNVYPELCKKQGLILENDHYINSLTRRQVFRKPGQTQ